MAFCTLNAQIDPIQFLLARDLANKERCTKSISSTLDRQVLPGPFKSSSTSDAIKTCKNRIQEVGRTLSELLPPPSSHRTIDFYWYWGAIAISITFCCLAARSTGLPDLFAWKVTQRRMKDKVPQLSKSSSWDRWAKGLIDSMQCSKTLSLP